MVVVALQLGPGVTTSTLLLRSHCDSNTIIQAPFPNKKDTHRIISYNYIMRRLDDRGHQVDVQILNNEVSVDFKITILEDWCATYQLVPPNIHQRNIAERAISTIKVHFLSFLAGVGPAFPKFMWDNLLAQTELTLNLLRQAILNPRISAWEYFIGAFDYAATTLVPIKCKRIIHTTFISSSW